MPNRPALLLLPLLLTACTERPLGETDGATTEPGTSGAPPATDTGGTGPTPTSITITTAPPPTTGGDTSTGVATTDDSATTVDSFNTSGEPPPKLDLFERPPPRNGLVGCILDPPAASMIGGDSPLGPFTADRAYFGWTGFDEPLWPILLFVSPAADAEQELQLQNGATGPILRHSVATDNTLTQGWLGTWPTHATLFADGMVFDPGDDAVTIDALAGNWDAFDPADPPRIVGTLAGPFTGSFDAVFCDKLVEFIIPE